MYFHPWLPTVTPSQPISLPRPAPTCARTFGASENTASTWKNCRPRSVRSLCPSIFPCDNILHVSSGYPIEALRTIGANRYRVLLTKVPPPPEQEGVQLRVELSGQGIPLFTAEIPRLKCFEKAAAKGVAVCAVDDPRAKRGWDAYQAVGMETLNHA